MRNRRPLRRDAGTVFGLPHEAYGGAPPSAGAARDAHARRYFGADSAPLPPLAAPVPAPRSIRQHAIAAIWLTAAAIVLIAGLTLARGGFHG